MKRSTILLTGWISLLSSQVAFADAPTKQQCIDANTQAQSFRTDGKLSSATEQLAICSNAACPQIVRDDCAERLDEVQRVQPTIVFSAKDGAGHDIADVKVDVDGQPLASKLDGRPIAVDPGDHAFTFTTPGQAPVTQHFVLREAEKDRREAITIGNAPAGNGTGNWNGSGIMERPEPRDPNEGKTQRILGVAIAGVGVVAVGLGAIFGLSASSSWSSAQNECSSSTNCAQRSQAEDDRSSALTKSTVSTIAFIAGGVFVAGGAVLFFTAPKHDTMTVGIAPAPGGAVLRGTF